MFFHYHKNDAYKKIVENSLNLFYSIGIKHFLLQIKKVLRGAISGERAIFHVAYGRADERTDKVIFRVRWVP